jgi:hypothetical protein
MSEENNMDDLVGNGTLDFHKFIVDIGSLNTNQRQVKTKK